MQNDSTYSRLPSSLQATGKDEIGEGYLAPNKHRRTMGPPEHRDFWLEKYKLMLTIREFEQRVDQLYKSAIMPGLAHYSIGQEATEVGVCAALERDDFITSTHRGHGHCLAKGAAAADMFAELLGRSTGLCHGKGGSMHIADPTTGNLGANAIVGGSAGIATGAALSAKLRRSGQVSVSFFGDGALGQGLLYEVMNMASIWKLPVIFVCENNMYQEFTPMTEVTAGEVLQRAEAFGIPVLEVDGQDLRAVHTAAADAVARARQGEGPSFLHCKTYRYHGHFTGDLDRFYRSREEEQDWQTNRDPIKLATSWLVDSEFATHSDLDLLTEQVRSEVERAMESAKSAEFPTIEEVTTDVFA